MFQEEDYLNCEEPYASVEVPKNGCTWAGCLYQRKDGGFDLFYDHANSEFESLETGKITMLRHMAMAGNGVVFVTRLDEERNQTNLLKKAEKGLLQWVEATIGKAHGRI